MKWVSLFFYILLLLSCNSKKSPLVYQSEFQKRLSITFKDASKSPLKEADLKNFVGLEFFPIDSSYVVEARIIPKLDTLFFDMETTTGAFTKERVFGVLTFKLNDQDIELNVYQSQESLISGSSYLFLPFIDDTNGVTTYGGGRYIDLSIPEGEYLWLDFNTAYNPYCAYNERYSCPVVPRTNYVPLEINAGVKAFRR